MENFPSLSDDDKLNFQPYPEKNASDSKDKDKNIGVPPFFKFLSFLFNLFQTQTNTKFAFIFWCGKLRLHFWYYNKADNKKWNQKNFDFFNNASATLRKP